MTDSSFSMGSTGRESDMNELLKAANEACAELARLMRRMVSLMGAFKETAEKLVEEGKDEEGLYTPEMTQLAKEMRALKIQVIAQKEITDQRLTNYLRACRIAYRENQNDVESEEGMILAHRVYKNIDKAHAAFLEEVGGTWEKLIERIIGDCDD